MLKILKHILVLLGLAFVCLPVLLLLMPYIEESRTESRTAQAYYDVRRLSDEYARPGLHDAGELPRVDPWGTPYRVVQLEGHRVRVLSAGPNMSMPPSGTDSDDIYSDMPVSPMEHFHVARDRQWLVALSATAIAWGLLASIYMRLVRSPRAPQPHEK